MDVRFDTYYDNEALNERLTWLAEQYPDIMQLETLGSSYEGREIPLVILTNRATGADLEKPAFWIDGNIHAHELTASAAVLYFIHKVVTNYGSDANITRLVDQQAFYIVPRLDPDGAALVLNKIPKYIRSGTRPYPYDYKQEGLHSEDVDQDGRMLQMRIEDPSGDWKVSERDPRLMIKRGLDEFGGTYYRLLPEGSMEDYDGYLIKGAPAYHGLDFNRNFPAHWRPEGAQLGAGDYPGSEAEIAAVIDFIAKHPNIFGSLSYHTYSRVILRPYGTKSDEEIDTHDLWVFEAIGERGTALTGYPCVSVFHDFKYHPKEVMTGTFDDWLYDHKGIYAYIVELWDVAGAAGIESHKKEKKFIEWFRKHPLEDDYKILEFIKQEAPEGLVSWYDYDHPQLGKVELGGWDFMYTWRNPPHHLLEAEIAPQADFALAFAATAPRLAWHTIKVTPVGDGYYQLLVVVENQGFLPTYGSQQAIKMKAAHPLRFEIDLPDGVTLKSGKKRQEIGHLEGRSNKMDVTSIWSLSATDNRAKTEWLIHAPTGGTLTLHLIGGRAGTLHREVTL